MTDIQIFEPEGRAIPYAVEGDGPGLVLIAGQGLGVDYLGSVAHWMAGEDFRVVRIGSRRPAGLADAAAPAGTAVSMSDLAQDVVDVMDHAGVATAWVGGHAFGGQRDIARHHRIPERFRDAEVEPMQIAARTASPLAPLAPGVPVLVLQGTDDTVTPVANGDALKASAPDRVSVVAIEGGTHMFPATHIGATSFAIEDYLDWD